jgi:cysteine-rich repeat protein
VCGDQLVSPGEDCDDGNSATGDCCVACRAEPGCYVPCERTADCAPQAVCYRHDDTCRATTGICRPRYSGQCPEGSVFAVCGCDGNAYETECAAWEAGVTIQGGDGLNSRVGSRCHCRPEVGLGCPAGRFCEMPYRCLGAVRRGIGGICVDLPADCAGDLGPPVCGCDGRTYRNDCERRLARAQKRCVCTDGVAAAPGARCGSAGPPSYACVCSGQSTWMARIDGCRQCQECEPPSLETAVRRLADQGIDVLASRVGHVGVCAACGCPSGRVFVVLVTLRDASTLTEQGWFVWEGR